MTLRTRLIPVTALVVALGASAASVTAAAASSSKTPTATATPVPSPQPVVKTVVTTVTEDGKDGKDKGGKNNGLQDWDAAAKLLGVSVQQLQDAMSTTKMWIGTSGVQPTPDLIVQHVADLLHKPAAQVKTALTKLGVFGDGRDKGKDKDGKGEPDWNAAAAKLGVTAQQLQDALMNTKIWIGESGVKPTPDVFIQHVAGLLHKPAAQVKAVLTQVGVFTEDSGPGKDKAPGGDKGKTPGGDKDKAKTGDSAKPAA